MSAAWGTVALVLVGLTAKGDMRLAMTVMIFTTMAMRISHPPRLILLRRVVHRRLSLMVVIDAIFTTGAALTVAWFWPSLWAFLVTDIASAAVALVGLYLWRPVWRPRLAWSKGIAAYFLRFGSRTALASLLNIGLDRGDDLWTGAVLGSTPLGYYSRAYRFATYPRSVVAAPVAGVVGGTYAQLAGDGNRLALSRAFFRVNAVMVRTGFGLAGALALLAPEFIRLVLGAKWLPMLDAFRLMLIFTMLDPLTGNLGSLFVAVGEPQRLVRTRFVQMGVLLVGLVGLGSTWGITGVALAVDLMVITGVGLFLWQARRFVDFSPLHIFGVPGLLLALALGAARLAIILPGVLGSDWRTAGTKLAVFGVIYCGGLFLFERRELLELYHWLRQNRSVKMKDVEL